MIKPDSPRERRDRGGGAPRGPQDPVLTNGLHTKISCGTTLVQHRARAGAGRPAPTHSRCLRCRFGQARRGASGRSLHAGRQGRRPRHRRPQVAFCRRTAVNLDSYPGQPATGGIATPSTTQHNRNAAPSACRRTSPSTLAASAGQVADRGHRQTTAHQREAGSCQPTISTRTFSTRQVTTYARKAPNSAPVVPSRK